MSCAKHPITVSGKTPETLARDIAHMRYDALALFLGALSFYLEEDAGGDEKRGRPLLAGALNRAAEKTNETAKEIRQAWQISKPHMIDELAITGDLLNAQEIEAARNGLREGIRQASEAASKRGYTIHPRIAAMRAKDSES